MKQRCGVVGWRGLIERLPVYVRVLLTGSDDGCLRAIVWSAYRLQYLHTKV
jgi:hypothetical protein